MEEGPPIWRVAANILNKQSRAADGSSKKVFERKMLRKIFGPTKEAKGIWRIKTNYELDEFIKHRNTINYVKAPRLSWFGHINRMP